MTGPPGRISRVPSIPLVTIRWMFSAEDDVIQEAGEDFAADFAHARFEMIPGVPA